MTTHSASPADVARHAPKRAVGRPVGTAPRAPLAPAQHEGEVTQYHIAEIAGVSQATVRRVLTGYRHVTPEKRRRVEAALARTGYRLNTAARAIRARRRGGVGIMDQYNAIYVPGALFIGVADVLAAEGLHTIFTPAPGPTLTEEGRITQLTAQLGVDGLLLLHPEGVQGGRQLAEMLMRFRVPAIWVNHRQPADSVYFDDEGDARRVVAALLARGHRRIAYVDLHGEAHYSQRDRAAGFRQGLSAAGLDGPVFGGEGAAANEPAIRALAAALAGPDRPTAFVCYSCGDTGVVAALARPHGLVSPRDFRMVAFATNEQYHVEAGVADVGAAAVVLDYRRLGQLAAKELLAKMADPTTPRASVAVANEINFREENPPWWFAGG